MVSICQPQFKSKSLATHEHSVLLCCRRTTPWILMVRVSKSWHLNLAEAPICLKYLVGLLSGNTWWKLQFVLRDSLGANPPLISTLLAKRTFLRYSPACCPSLSSGAVALAMMLYQMPWPCFLTIQCPLICKVFASLNDLSKYPILTSPGAECGWPPSASVVYSLPASF